MYLQNKLITLNEAINMEKDNIKKLHKEYMNSSLVFLLSALNFDIKFVKANGIFVWDANGRKYLDFLGGYGSLNIGHNHPYVIEAINKVLHMPNLLQVSLGSISAALAHNLATISPGNLQRSFFCNSGAEAVECALKLARIYTGKKKFIYCQNSFHGKTFGALSVTGRSKYQEPFKPLLPECIAVEFGNLDSLENALSNNDVAAFIVEPIQGEGGINVPPDNYLSQAVNLCHKHNALIIIDEIQTGLGRTGYMFACEKEKIAPDILCLAKSLGGGVMPIGACITTDKIWQKAYGSINTATLHTSTFGGNTLAAAAALATIEVIHRENLVEQTRKKGEYFLSALLKLKEKHHILHDMRGQGLLIGVEFARSQKTPFKLIQKALDKISVEYIGALIAGELLNKYGIITAYTLNNPNVIRLEPPLTVEYHHIDMVIQALDEILSKHKNFFNIAVSGIKTIFSKSK